ncbi:excalibur calcium-binding domain-containing protein [Mycobacterium colombiense]|uniref:excalibur calcium-binding domain-containing protein n=1 Tax=Mycobacterium colombiense TaxID=339268 RepID=UPI001C12BCC5|nr:excalibur calcium-binding domain-containing protein [Mycobacterium colombiense]
MPVAQAAPPTTTTSPSPTSGGSAYAPIYRGQPGYRSGLDRDNDGIACEVCH